MPAAPTPVNTVFNGRVYEAEQVLMPGETAIVYLPGTGPASVAVHATGSEAEVRFTMSPQAVVVAGAGRFLTAAIGVDGLVSDKSAAAEIPAPATAVQVSNLGVLPIVMELLQ